MSDFNNVSLIGRLTSNPQSRYTQGGTEVSVFSIANNYYSKNKNEVNYFNITAFGKLAETANKYLTKREAGINIRCIKAGKMAGQTYRKNTVKSNYHIVKYTDAC